MPQRMLECKECYNDTLQYLQDIHHRFKASRIHMIQYIHHTKQENIQENMLLKSQPNQYDKDKYTFHVATM